MAKYKKTQHKIEKAIDIITTGTLRFSKKITDTSQTIGNGLSDIKEGNVKMKKVPFKNQIIVTHHNRSWNTYSFF